MGNAKLPISCKWPAVEQNGVRWDSGVVYGVYMQVLELWPMAKFHAQI